MWIQFGMAATTARQIQPPDTPAPTFLRDSISARAPYRTLPEDKAGARSVATPFAAIRAWSLAERAWLTMALDSMTHCLSISRSMLRVKLRFAAGSATAPLSLAFSTQPG